MTITKKIVNTLFVLAFPILSIAQHSTVSFNNVTTGENKGMGMNIEFMQAPTWQTSPLMLNKLPYGVFEHDILNSSLPEAKEWKFINGTASGDKTAPYQGKQCLKFVSNGTNGLISGQSQLFFASTLPQKFSIALKAGPGFTGTVSVELRNQYFSNQDNLTTPNITLTNEWKVYTYDLKNIAIGNFIDRANILIKGAGTVFLDDAKIYTAADDRGDKFSKSVVDKLKEFQPGLLRWGAIPANFYNFSESTGIGAPNRFTYGDWIKISNELNCVPNICVGVDYKTDYVDATSPTFKKLAEYLTGDNTTDGGKIRLTEGITTPLIETPKEIILEMGNEVWAGAAHGASFYSTDGQVSMEEYMKFTETGIAAMNSVPTYAANKSKISVVYSGWSVSAGDTWNLSLIDRKFKRLGDQIALSGYLGGNLALENGVPLTDPNSLDAQADYYKKTIANIPVIIGRAKQLTSATTRSQGKNMPFFFYEGTMTSEKYFAKLGQAVVYMDYIMEMFRQGNLSWPVAFNFTGGQYALVYFENNQWKSKPMFTLGKLFNQSTKGKILSSSITGPLDSITTGGIKYPKVGHFITSPDGKSFSVMLTNRDFFNDQTVKIDLPAGSTFSNSATITTVSAANWNVDKESDMNIATNTISDFSKDKNIVVPKFGVVIVKFTGNLILTDTENSKVEKLNVSVFPNPTNNTVTIEGALNPLTKVYNVLGTEVMTSNDNTINMSTLGKGIFTLVIKSGDKVTKEKVIVVE